MTRVLVATASVHTTAAACDYLEGKLDSEDEVVILTVREAGVASRDSGDAGNVARTRLLEPTIETRTEEGEPAAIIREAAHEVEADELVVGPRRGDPDVAGEPPGSTTRELVEDPPVPVVVVPP